MPDAAHDLAEALRPALYRLYRLLRRESEGLGVTGLQFLLLAIIGKNPGIGTAELARMERLRGPTISGHVRLMEAAGLITRSAGEHEDRRRVGLTATAQGQAVIDEMQRRRVDWLARRIAHLSDAERSALAAAIAPLARLSE
jgi:DNA-binding MarR family transcriptional regulator